MLKKNPFIESNTNDPQLRLDKENIFYYDEILIYIIFWKNK